MVRFSRISVLIPLLVACAPNDLTGPGPDTRIPLVNSACETEGRIIARSGCGGCIENVLQCIGSNWSCISNPRGACTPVPDAGPAPIVDASVSDGATMADVTATDVVVIVTDAGSVVDVAAPVDAAPCTNGVGACARSGFFVRNPNGVPICTVTPGLPTTETCNGLDDNCNSVTDEGCQCTVGATESCYGGPERTAGVGICHGGMRTCTTADAGATSAVWGACVGEVRPAAIEVCTNIRDDNCNGRIDELPCSPPAPM